MTDRNPLKLKRKDLGNLLKLYFPSYRGRNITLRIQEKYRLHSSSLYWSGGSRTEFVAFSQDGTKLSSDIGTSNPIFMDHDFISFDLGAELMVLELQKIGMSSYLNVYVGLHSDWLPPLLTAIKKEDI